jgi:hypothetical protein
VQISLAPVGFHAAAANRGEEIGGIMLDADTVKAAGHCPNFAAVGGKLPKCEGRATALNCVAFAAP